MKQLALLLVTLKCIELKRVFKEIFYILQAQDNTCAFFLNLMANYTYDRIKEFAEIITEKIGFDKLYTTTNEKYPKAHPNYILRDPVLLIDMLIDHFNELDIAKEIYDIERKNITSFSGVYVNRPEYIYINIFVDSSDCWQRFTKVKECCSAFVGHYQSEIIKNTIYEGEEDYATSIEEAFDRKINYVNNDGLEEGDIDCETFAILLATELMIPLRYRYITQDLLTQVGNSHITLNDVAKSLMIPETVLRLFKNKGKL